MSAIYAGPIVANMIDLEAIRYRTVFRYEGQAVGVDVRAARANAGAQLDVTFSISCVAYDLNARRFHSRVGDPLESERAFLPSGFSRCHNEEATSG